MKMPADEDPDESIVRGGGRRYAVRVEITIDAGSEHNFWSDASKDIAEGGVFLATHQLLRIGTVVEIGIRIEGREQLVTCTGVVQWTRAQNPGVEEPMGVGIKFVELPDDERDAFREFAQTVREPIVYEPPAAPSRRRRASREAGAVPKADPGARPRRKR
jgi:uncharacterized protein (TIGR02266 family)